MSRHPMPPHSSSPEVAPEILLLQEMADASFRHMDQDRMVKCCTAGLTNILGGQGAALLVKEAEQTWCLRIYTQGNLSDQDRTLLKHSCEKAFNNYASDPIVSNACRVEILNPKTEGRKIPGLSEWTPLPLWVDEHFQGLLLLDLAGASDLPPRLAIILHQLCTGLRSIQNMRQLLITDPMTGCYNRWFMDIELTKFCENTSMQHDAFALMILDVDRFKHINDYFGHARGDEILVNLSEMLRQHLSPGDAAIRMGGDEFLLWFPRVKERNLQELGQKILAEATATLSIMEVSDLKITLSIGFVQQDPSDKDLSKEQLLERADRALYTSKRNGKNQLTTWSPHPKGQPFLWGDPPQGEHQEFRALERRVRELEHQQSTDQERLVEMLSNLLSIKEFETGLHSFRVAKMTACLLEHLEVSSQEKIDIIRGAKLHDIGKIAIPEAILHKTEKLSETDWTIIRQHPQLGKRILENQKFLDSASDIVLYHHECFDGSGYPMGLKGEQIPFGARLFALVDAYDTMRANRLYKTSMSQKNVLEELERKSGTQFDPNLFKFFRSHIEELEKIGQWQS